MKKSRSHRGRSASQMIDARIQELGDWRGRRLSRLRALIQKADPEIVEEWKWRGVPVWSHDGLICTGETYKSVVKMTFAKGASLPDPSGLFNSSLEGNTRRAIDFHQGDEIDGAALKALIRAAVALNTSMPATARAVRARKGSKSARRRRPPRLGQADRHQLPDAHRRPDRDEPQISGGAVRRDGSLGLLMPTWIPSGSSTIA